MSFAEIKSVSENYLVSHRAQYFRIDIPIVDGKTDMLYCKGFTDILHQLGLTSATGKVIDTLSSYAVNVFLGASGAGKTRTCLDVASAKYSLYFDCSADADIRHVLSRVETVSDVMTELELVLFTQKIINALIASRIHILVQKGQTAAGRLAPWKWFSYQRSRQFQHAVVDRVQFLMASTNWRPDFDQMLAGEVIGIKSRDLIVMLDEAQVLLDCAKNKYRAIRTKVMERSLFSFMTRTLAIHCGLGTTIIAGTQVRLKTVELLESVGAEKPNARVRVFTDFTYYSAREVSFLLSEALTVEAFGQVAASDLNTASELLQGRPRFVSSFLARLAVEPFVDSGFGSFFSQVLGGYVNDCVKDGMEFSLYTQWQTKWNAYLIEYQREPNSASQGAIRVLDVLVELVIGYFFRDLDFSTVPVHDLKDIDLVSTALVRVSQHSSNEMSYSIVEPLPVIAGINFLADQHPNTVLDALSSSLWNKSAHTSNEQAKGKTLEFIVALRFRQGWWLDMLNDYECRKLLPGWMSTQLSQLPPPINVHVSASKDEHGTDFAVRNFAATPVTYLMPDNNLGPDGLWSFINVNLKSSWTRQSSGKYFVSKGECDKNLRFCDLANWSQNNAKRRDLIAEAFQDSAYPGLLSLRIELPYPSPELLANFRNSCPCSDDNSATIWIHLDSPFAKYLFSPLFIQRWKKYME